MLRAGNKRIYETVRELFVHSKVHRRYYQGSNNQVFWKSKPTCRNKGIVIEPCNWDSKQEETSSSIKSKSQSGNCRNRLFWKRSLRNLNRVKSFNRELVFNRTFERGLMEARETNISSTHRKVPSLFNNVPPMFAYIAMSIAKQSIGNTITTSVPPPSPLIDNEETSVDVLEVAQTYRTRADELYLELKDLRQRRKLAIELGFQGEADRLSSILKGGNHEVLIKAAHEAAVRTILEEQRCLDTGIIDLHGLRVDEALAECAEFLEQHSQKGKYGAVRIVTGVGKHSADGIPKIKPAVEEFLQQRGFRYQHFDMNLGALIVTLPAAPVTTLITTEVQPPSDSPILTIFHVLRSLFSL